VSGNSHVSSEQLAAGREKRRARLFERHCNGARLTSDERAEIADLIYQAATAGRADELKLDASPPHAVSRRTGLAHPLQHYADLLDVGLRTVKRWLADGVKARVACPLDDLVKFPEWWKRVHPHRPLDSRVALSIERASQPLSAAVTASQVQVSTAEASATEGKETEPPPPATKPEPARPLITLGDIAAITLEENLVKLKTLHAANMEVLERAFKAGSQSEVDARQRNVERSANMLLGAQTALDKHLKERGDLMPREEIKRELQRVHSAMAQSLIGLLVGLGIHRDRAISLADTWFGHLRQSRFAITTAPELRPPTASAA
jgi:hypothetical protein